MEAKRRFASVWKHISLKHLEFQWFFLCKWQNIIDAYYSRKYACSENDYSMLLMDVRMFKQDSESSAYKRTSHSALHLGRLTRVL